MALFQWDRDERAKSGLALSRWAAVSLGVNDSQSVTLRVSNRRAPATVTVDPNLPDGMVRLGTEQRDRLRLSSPLIRRFTFRLKGNAQKEIRFGPVIGLLIGRTRDEIRQNRHGYSIFNTLWHLRSMGGIAYFFSLEDIDWDRELVFGHVHIPKRVPVETPPRAIPFETGEFPFPDAIYRRRFIPYDALAKIEEHITPHIFNNPRSSHKLRQARALQKIPSLAPHVPDVQELTSSHVLDTMLDRYGAVFVKRSGLGAGTGVFRVTRPRTTGYTLTRRENSKGADEVQEEVSSFQQLTELLPRLTGYPWRASAWCVQQAIPPGHWKGYPFDFRVTVQKNGLGRWVVNGAYVRRAPAKDAIMTRRGDYVQALEFAQHKWGSEGMARLSEIFQFVLESAVALDNDLGPLGDLGIDILLDEDDKIWFLEGNAGPGYRPVGEDDPDFWRQITAPLTYASFLAGFPVRSEFPMNPGPRGNPEEKLAPYVTPPARPRKESHR